MISQQLKLIGMTISALSVLGCALSAAASDSGAGPFGIQVSLLSSAQIALGEPILIRYKLTNTSPQNVVTHLGIYGTDWYTIDMHDSQGVAVPLIPDKRPVHPQGDYSSKGGFFSEGYSDTDYIAITKRLVIQHPGRYTLTVHARLPYVMDDSLTEGTSESLATSSGLIQTQDTSFSILIMDPDPIRLRNTAEVLRKESVDTQNCQLALANLDALFSMPEAQAAASWRTVAMKPSVFTDSVVGELADLRSATGADILAEMLGDPALTRDRINVSLNRLYNAGSPALREHIKGIAREKGFEMPEMAGTPYVPEKHTPPAGGTAF